MKYVLVSEDTINSFITMIQKYCGVTRPIKLSYVPKLLEEYKKNDTCFVDSILNGGSMTVKAPESLTRIRPYAFYSYQHSICAEFTGVNEIGSYAFCNCSAPITLGLPLLTTIGTYAFSGCTSLSSIRLPMIQRIESYAFYNCESLQSVYITTDTIPALAHSNAFSNTSIMSSGSIFVKPSMLSSFKNADQWSFFADHIIAV